MVRKTAFWSHFILKTIILPRQARDKLRENSKTEGVLCRVAELSDAEQAVLEPAYIYGHPLIENDGEAVDRESRTDSKQFSYQRKKD